MLSWSANCVISSNAVSNQVTFTLTDTKFYVPVVALLTQDNAELLQQLKSGFKHIIIWNKYPSKVSAHTRNQYLVYLIDSSCENCNCRNKSL